MIWSLSLATTHREAHSSVEMNIAGKRINQNMCSIPFFQVVTEEIGPYDLLDPPSGIAGSVPLVSRPPDIAGLKG
jgi:hypothetical protein